MKLQTIRIPDGSGPPKNYVIKWIGSDKLVVETVIPNEQSEASLVRMKLLIWTDDVLENYGYWGWDGDGPCP